MQDTGYQGVEVQRKKEVLRNRMQLKSLSSD